MFVRCVRNCAYKYIDFFLYLEHRVSNRNTSHLINIILKNAVSAYVAKQICLCAGESKAKRKKKKINNAAVYMLMKINPSLMPAVRM